MMVMRRAYIERNRDAARNAVKAIIEGIHSYKTNKEQTLKAIGKYMKVQEREVLEEAFRAYDFPLKPYPAKEYFELPIQEVARQDPRVLKENPERFTDSSLVKELDESGFIEADARVRYKKITRIRARLNRLRDCERDWRTRTKRA